MNWIEVLKMPSRGKARKLFFAEFKQAVLDVFEDKDKISNRIEGDLLDPFKHNPYTHSLHSFAY